MPGHDFFFSLEFSSQGAPLSLLDDLALHVLGHVGCAAEGLDGLSGAIQTAVVGGSVGGPRRCDVQFRANGATLDVVVSANGGRIWQTSIAIPTAR